MKRSRATFAFTLALLAAGQDRKTEPDLKAADLERFSEDLRLSMLQDLNIQTNEDLEILGELLRANLMELYAPYASVALPHGSNRLSEYCRTRNCFQCHDGPLDASRLCDRQGRQFIPLSVWNVGAEGFEESLMGVIEVSRCHQVEQTLAARDGNHIFP